MRTLPKIAMDHFHLTEQTQLRPGDKLFLLDDEGLDGILTKGEVYTFKRWGNGDTLELMETDPELMSGGFLYDRFALVPKVL